MACKVPNDSYLMRSRRVKVGTVFDSDQTHINSLLWPFSYATKDIYMQMVNLDSFSGWQFSAKMTLLVDKMEALCILTVPVMIYLMILKTAVAIIPRILLTRYINEV